MDERPSHENLDFRFVEFIIGCACLWVKENIRVVFPYYPMQASNIFNIAFIDI